MSSGARRTLPPTGWLRASPCPPAKRVVKSYCTLKRRIFKPAVFNPFQTDADRPGLLESTYQKCLCYELTSAGIAHEAEQSLPVRYKGQEIECGYRIDVLIEKKLILELKSVQSVLEVHKAQILSYMKLSGCQTGLLMNFDVKLLKNGITRFKL